MWMPLLRSLDERGEKVEWNPEPGWVLFVVLVRLEDVCGQEMGFIFKELSRDRGRDRDPGSQDWSQAWRRLGEFSTAACQGTEPYAAKKTCIQKFNLWQRACVAPSTYKQKIPS